MINEKKAIFERIHLLHQLGRQPATINFSNDILLAKSNTDVIGNKSQLAVSIIKHHTSRLKHNYIQIM